MSDNRIYVGGLGQVPGSGVAPANPAPDIREQPQLLEEVRTATKEAKRKRKAEELDRLEEVRTATKEAKRKRKAEELERMMERAHARKAAKRKRKAEDQDRVAHERESMQKQAHILAKLHSEQMHSLVKDLIKIVGDGQRGGLP
jgi:F0F1-type ATP synthase membrane subunit b/b'